MTSAAIDPFAEYGERTARAPKAKPVNHAREALVKVQQEQQQLGRLYRMQRDAWFFRTLDCPEGPRLQQMMAWAKTLGPDDGDELIETLKGETWLLNAGPDLRFAALQLLAQEIARIRKSIGLKELDDPIGLDEPVNEPAFFIIKKILRVK